MFEPLCRYQVHISSRAPHHLVGVVVFVGEGVTLFQHFCSVVCRSTTQVFQCLTQLQSLSFTLKILCNVQWEKSEYSILIYVLNTDSRTTQETWAMSNIGINIDLCSSCIIIIMFVQTVSSNYENNSSENSLTSHLGPFLRLNFGEMNGTHTVQKCWCTFRYRIFDYGSPRSSGLSSFFLECRAVCCS